MLCDGHNLAIFDLAADRAGAVTMARVAVVVEIVGTRRSSGVLPHIKDSDVDGMRGNKEYRKCNGRDHQRE